MNDELKNTIKDGIEKLPKEVKEVVDSFDWIKISVEIGKKYLLDENEINILQNEIGLVIIGTNNQDSLVLNIENHVGMGKKEAIEMVEEIKQQIFEPMTNKIHSIVKKDLEYKNISWDQTVNFIVFGGDYSVFLENK